MAITRTLAKQHHFPPSTGSNHSQSFQHHIAPTSPLEMPMLAEPTFDIYKVKDIDTEIHTNQIMIPLARSWTDATNTNHYQQCPLII